MYSSDQCYYPLLLLLIINRCKLSYFGGCRCLNLKAFHFLPSRVQSGPFPFLGTHSDACLFIPIILMERPSMVASTLAVVLELALKKCHPMTTCATLKSTDQGKLFLTKRDSPQHWNSQHRLPLFALSIQGDWPLAACNDNKKLLLQQVSAACACNSEEWTRCARNFHSTSWKKPSIVNSFGAEAHNNGNANSKWPSVMQLQLWCSPTPLWMGKSELRGALSYGIAAKFGIVTEQPWLSWSSSESAHYIGQHWMRTCHTHKLFVVRGNMVDNEDDSIVATGMNCGGIVCCCFIYLH